LACEANSKLVANLPIQNPQQSAGGQGAVSKSWKQVSGEGCC